MTLDRFDVLRLHLDAENAHDLPATLATVHPDCRFQDHATGQIGEDRWPGLADLPHRAAEPAL